MIHFASYISVFRWIFNSDCLLFSDNISQGEILKPSTIKNVLVTYRNNQSCFVLFPIFLLQCIALTYINPIAAISFNVHFGHTNQKTSGVKLSSSCIGLSSSSMALSSSPFDASSSSQLSSHLFGLCKLSFHVCQFLVSQTLSGSHSSLQ